MSDRPAAPVHVPIRTCVGCRQRAERGELLRLAIVDEPGGAVVPRVLPDPRGRLIGRGGWIHPRSSCWALAVRRGALGRALRRTGQLDLSAVEEYVALIT